MGFSRAVGSGRGAVGVPPEGDGRRPDRLGAWQALRCVAVALSLWALAILLIRWGGPAGWFRGVSRWSTFAAAALAGWPTVRLARRVGRLAPPQVVPGVALGTAAATIADGIALTWWPALYGADPAGLLTPAAWLLWAVGFGLLAAWLGSGKVRRYGSGPEGESPSPP